MFFRAVYPPDQSRPRFSPGPPSIHGGIRENDDPPLRRTGVATAIAAAALLALPAVANAAVTVGEPGSAGMGAPSQTNEMCGTAYIGNFKLGAPPEDAQAIAGLTVTLTLFDSSGNEIDSSDAVTNDEGVFCSAGADAQQGVMLNGGRTRLSYSQADIDAYNAAAEVGETIAFNRVLGGTEGARIGDLMPITNISAQNINGNNLSFLIEGTVDDGPDITHPFYGGSLGTGSYIGVLDGLLQGVQAGSTGLNGIVNGTGSGIPTAATGGN